MPPYRNIIFISYYYCKKCWNKYQGHNLVSCRHCGNELTNVTKVIGPLNLVDKSKYKLE